MGGNTATYFKTGDVIVFAGTLVLSGIIGLYFAVKDRKKTVKNYYYGGKVMHPIPLGISISVTFISALTVIALPTEAYVYGIVATWYTFDLVISVTIACVYYIPLMHNLQLDSIYQFLELRFHPILRRIVSACEVVSTLCYMGATVYIPALALNAVTPISIQWSILLTSGVCTLYTTFGGIKAVVWTDVAQATIMLIGALAALVKTTMLFGEMSDVFSAIERSGRNNLFDFNLDPTFRSTFWTVLIGSSISSCSESCTNQSIYQRYLSCKSVKGARVAAMTAILPKILLNTIAILSGCAAYAYFEGCDPVNSGKINKYDQLMPYLVLTIFRDTPGMAGFFVAAAYSGTMSTFSSGINAMSVQVIEDFVVPLRPNLNNTSKLFAAKITVFALGVTAAVLAYAASLVTGTVVSIITTVRGAFEGPILGIFTLGVFFPWTTTKGAVAGHLVSFVTMTWIGLGGLLGGRSPESQGELPTSTDRCMHSNNTNWTTQSGALDYSVIHAFNLSTPASPNETYYNPMYAISLLYTTAMGMTLTVVVGLLVSFCTGANDPKQSDPNLFSPFVSNHLLPQKVRTFFRFGVPERSSSSVDIKGNDSSSSVPQTKSYIDHDIALMSTKL